MKYFSVSTFMRWHLILFFVAAVILGYLFPIPGTVFNEVDFHGICFNNGACVFSSTSDFLIAFIFILSGLCLSTEELKGSILSKENTIFPLFSILMISPLIAFWTINWNFKTEGYSLGLSLTFLQATTLSSGPIIASQADGNVALALFLTVSTNFLAVFSVPLFLERILADAEGLKIDAGNLIVHLLIVILLPLIIGKGLRKYLKPNTQKAFNICKLMSTGCLSLIIWSVVSASASEFDNIDAVSTLLLVLSVTVIHISLLVFNFVVARYLLRVGVPEQRSITICCAQKTFGTAITILEQLEVTGVPILPLLVNQIVQIIIDAILAAYWTSNKKKADEASGKIPSTEDIPIEAETKDIKLA